MEVMDLVRLLNEPEDAPPLDKSQVYKWLKGQLPRGPNLLRVAAALELLDMETGAVRLEPGQWSDALEFDGRTLKTIHGPRWRLLIIGAMSVVRWAVRRGVPAGSWLARMLARKPRMLVAIALANKMARVAWALLATGANYRAPAAVAA